MLYFQLSHNPKQKKRMEQEKQKEEIFRDIYENKLRAQKENENRSWSLKHEKCLGCGTTTQAHNARGYCENCYAKYVVRKTADFYKNDPAFLGNIKSKISKTNKEKRNAVMKIVDRLDEELLKNLYHKQKNSLQDIATEFNCSRVYIYNLCKRYGIEIKTKSKARSDAKLSGKDVRYHKADENFFKNWSHGMAYVLGFIYTDGYINKRLRYFSVSQKEIEILQKIKEIMKSDHEITRQKRQDIYCLTIGTSEMVKDLLRIGLTPAKSLTIKFPEVPARYVNSFIRGVFDGDGSISHQHATTWRVAFASASADFINGIKNTLNNYSGASEKRIYVDKKLSGKNYYTLIYTAKDDIVKLLNFMYDSYSLDNEIYLTRKYLQFKKATDL